MLLGEAYIIPQSIGTKPLQKDRISDGTKCQPCGNGRCFLLVHTVSTDYMAKQCDLAHIKLKLFCFDIN